MSSVLISQLIFIYFLIPLSSLESSYFSQYVVALPLPCAFNVGRLLGAKYHEITVITERCHSMSISS